MPHASNTSFSLTGLGPYVGLSQAKPFLACRPLYWLFPLLSMSLCTWSSFPIAGAQVGVTCSERPSPTTLSKVLPLPPFHHP